MEVGRVRLGNRDEPDGVTRPKLPYLPQFSAGDDGRADEAAERWPVRTEDDRCVPGEVERADRIRGVVDVRRVQPGFAAVAARPGRLRPDEADAGPRGIVVDLVVGGVQIVDVLSREELRCGVRPLHDTDLPMTDD